MTASRRASASRCFAIGRDCNLSRLLSEAPIDRRLFFAIYPGDGATGFLHALALALSAIGSGWVLLVLLPLGLHARFRALAATLAALAGGTSVVVALLKHTIGRVRPCTALPGVHALCAAPTDPSFPSGHACGGFAVVTFVLLAVPAPRGAPGALVRVALVLVAAGIAWSRVYLGVHFPFDGVAGGAFGGSSGALAARFYRSRVPSASPD